MKERMRTNADERAQRVRRIVEDCLTQRLAGRGIADEAILSAHPDLLPELAEELRAARVIQQAQRRAQDTLLLTSQDETSGGDDETRLRADGDSAAAGLPAPAAIPGYEIKREIHRGGQGVVYEALQKTTGRIVAIKVMKEGPFAGPGDRARFEREVRVMAQLKHPNIVTIHDSGTAAGNFFYVMDYIPGQPLNDYIQRVAAGLPPRALATAGETVKPASAIRETLRLFAEICEAVNVAHLRGVIHRDLKPGNIRLDPSGRPHILDFGLAKLSEFDVLEDTPTAAMTQTGQFVGSLPWASPEQTEGKPDRIDLRTDVYALGVISYQMLTGKFPYLVIGAFQDVLHNIQHAAPLPPRALCHEIDDEVETIVLKCLSKEPERRYQSAGEIARDIRNYLAGEPIEAKRDSALYVLRKMLRRHRTATAVAAGFFLLVMVSTAALWVMYRNQSQERARAEWEARNARLAEAEQARQRERAENNEALAKANEQQAKTEAAKFKAVNEFVQNDMLSSVDPEKARGREITVREILDDTARQLDEGKLAQNPTVEAEVRYTVGWLYLTLVRFEEAERHLRRALELRKQVLGEREDAGLAGNLNALALLLHERGDLQGAEPLYREALEMYRRLFSGDQQNMAVCVNNLGVLLKERGDWAAAEAHYREALAMRRRLFPAGHPDVAVSLTTLASLFRDLGNLPEAEPLQREALELQRRFLPPDSPDIAASLCNLATLVEDRGDLAEAERLCREALEMQRRIFPGAHPDTACSLNNLARLLHIRGDLAAAEPLYREALQMVRKVYQTAHPETALMLHHLADILQARANFAEAEPLAVEAVELYRTHPEWPPREYAHALSVLAEIYEDTDQGEKAVPALQDYLKLQQQTLSKAHPHIASVLARIGMNLLKARRFAEAEPVLRECRTIRAQALPPEDWLQWNTLSLLGEALAGQASDPALALDDRLARFAEAEPLLIDAAEKMNPPTANLNRKYAAFQRVAQFYDAWRAAEPDKGYDAKAAKWRAKLETWRASTQPASQPVMSPEGAPATP